MPKNLIVLLVISELVSLYLVYRVLRSQLHLAYKVVALLLGFVPVVGPVMLMFSFDSPPVQKYRYRNNFVGYTGENRERHEALQKQLNEKMEAIEESAETSHNKK